MLSKFNKSTTYWYNPISLNKKFIAKEKILYKENFIPVYTSTKYTFYLIMFDSIVSNINSRQNLQAFLQRFYGYGLSRALKIALLFAFGKQTYAFDILNKRHRNVMMSLVEKKKYLLDYALETRKKKNITRLRSMKCYRGLRHALYLPVRGQRTHTNAHTARYVSSRTFEYVPRGPSSKKIKTLSKYTRRKRHILVASISRHARLLTKSYNEFKKYNKALFKQLEKKNKLGAFSRIHKEKLKLEKAKAKLKRKKSKK
jgi:small subunit ribosomal protein S13